MPSLLLRYFAKCVFCLFFTTSVSAKNDSILIIENQFKSPAGVWSSEPKLKQARVRSVVIWFHGGMQSTNCKKGVVAGRGLYELLNDSTVIVASPSACQNSHWISPELILITDKLIDSLESRFKMPIQEIDLAGISDGGLGVLAYSLNGKRVVRSRLLISSNLSVLGQAKVLAKAPKLKSGTWTFLQGGHDRLYPANIILPWLRSFCEGIGPSCELHFDELGEHDWSYWAKKRPDWIQGFRSSKIP